MTHRRYHKPQPLAPPLRSNEARLKHIYEAQQIFKEKHKEHSLRKSKPKPQEPDHKTKTPLNLNLAEIKHSHRYRQPDKEHRGQSFHVYGSTQQEKTKHRSTKEQGILSSRNRQDSIDKHELFKIRRKSISGSLKKKMKEQTAQYLSANPVMPVQLNYYEEARKLYKEGKNAEALRLFELTLEKDPKMCEAHYYIALCLLGKHSYQKAYSHLTIILSDFPDFKKKTVYLFAAIAAKNLQMLEQGLELTTKGIEKYPDYTDLYAYRAKIQEQTKKYMEAIADYEVALKVKKDNPQILLSYAICLKNVNRLSNCLATLNSAFYADQSGQTRPKILIERIKIFLDKKQFKEMKKDVAKLEELSPEQSELYYYKGLLQIEEKNKKAALLSFERCIRYNTSSECVVSALVEIAKSKIQDRDFYSAYYHISRASHLHLTSPQIQKFLLFTEGVVFLMKRKINEGVENLNRLGQKYTLGSYFDSLFYLYRAFGYFMQNKHDLAIEDYKMAEMFTPKDKYITYNQLIAEGVVLVNKKQFVQALQKFDAAQSMISQNSPSFKIEPFIYRAMTFVEKVKSQKKDQIQILQQIFIALKQLDKAYDVNDGNSNMLYLRSLIYMYLAKTDEGLQDIIKAISKSEENVAKYFFYRALAHQTMNNSKQANNDFNICINLDERYSNAYLQRAKLLFSNEQTAKGLEDLKKYKELIPNCDIKVHECCLYYLQKDYDLAEDCLAEIETPSKKQQLQKLIYFKQLRISEVKDRLERPADRMICDIILGSWFTEEVEPEEIEFFSRMEYHCYLGIKYYHLGQFQDAINHFSMAIKEKTLMDLEQNNPTAQEDADSQDPLESPIQSQTKQSQLHYLNFNLFLAYLANKQAKKAYEIFVRDLLPAKEQFLRSEMVGSLSKLLFQSMKATQDAKEKEVFEINLFRSMLGQSSQDITIDLPLFILRTKLCYPMPYAKQLYQEYSAKINPGFMLQSLKISEVQNRPEPPWVKRSHLDLIFTDEVQNINIEFQNTQHDEENQDEDQYEGDEGQEGQAEDESVQQDNYERQDVFDPRRFKEQMKLDDDLERKLKKLMQKNSG